MTVATIEKLESKVLIQSGSLSLLIRNNMETSTISSLNKEIQHLWYKHCNALHALQFATGH